MSSETTATVKRCRKGDGKNGPWCLYTRDGDRLLGSHPTKQDAYKQEYAIEKSKTKGMVATLIDVGLELQRRKSLVAAEVLAAAEDLMEDLDKQLDRAGFENPMKRDEEVAEEVSKDKIPILPPIEEVAQ